MVENRLYQTMRNLVCRRSMSGKTYLRLVEILGLPVTMTCNFCNILLYIQWYDRSKLAMTGQNLRNDLSDCPVVWKQFSHRLQYVMLMSNTADILLTLNKQAYYNALKVSISFSAKKWHKLCLVSLCANPLPCDISSYST